MVKCADSLQLRMLPGKLVKKMQADDDFWYANAVFEKKKLKKKMTRMFPLVNDAGFKLYYG